jgi:hyperosmotically inducible periplasmic protein
MKQYKVPVVLTAAIANMANEHAHRHDAMPDNRIDTIFRGSYVFRTFLHDSVIVCSDNDGVVSLSGTVVDESHRVLAQETIACLPGVVRVENHLRISPHSPAEDDVADMSNDYADHWIARRLQLTLLFHRNVSAIATVVSVKDGVVTLSGVSTSCAQCDLTSEYAKDIDGVKNVINNMTVARSVPLTPRSTSERLDDASITAQIRTALIIHRSTSALGATVEVRHGDVTVTGIAANAAEKALVSKLVTGIHGVGEVRNNMTVRIPVSA